MLHSEYFYSIKDFYEMDINSDWVDEFGHDNTFSVLLLAYPNDLEINSLAYHGYSSTYSTIMNGVWDLLKTRHRFSYCFKSEKEIETMTLAEQMKCCIKLLNSFVDVFNMTMPRYLPLLKAYQDNDATPLQKVKSETEGKTRFNDTPQGDDLADGYYSDDSHATNVTAAITETSTDPASLYEQLDGLYKNWRSVIRDWCDEFDLLFIDEVNLK